MIPHLNPKTGELSFKANKTERRQCAKYLEILRTLSKVDGPLRETAVRATEDYHEIRKALETNEPPSPK